VVLADLVAVFAPRVRVLSGTALLDRPVRWVHATDLLDPSPYLKAGEMVLTNGVWRRRPADSERFVESLTRAGASALGFGVMTATARTPADVIEACDRAGLPLVEIPYDMPFRELSEAVATYFSEERQRGLIQALRRDQAMLSSLAQGAGLAAFLNMLARDYRLPLALLTHGGQVLASTPPGVGREDALAIWKAVGSARQPAAIEVDGARLSAFPIVVQMRLQACLVCWKPLDELTDEERAAVEQELAFIEVELAHARTRREIQQRFVAELLDLIAGGESKLTEVARRLRSLGVDPYSPMAALAIEPRDAHTSTPGALSEAAERFCASRGYPAAAPSTESRVIVIAGVRSDEQASDLAHGLYAEFAQDGWEARIGVGGLCTAGISHIQRSVVQAEHALDRAIAGGQVGSVTTVTEIGSYAMLFEMHDSETKRSFVSALLGALVERDRRHGTQLVHTLDVYLSAGANWQRAADRLHVHVNTLRYRISQVEKITGRDLSSTDDRVSLYIALRGATSLEASNRAGAGF
jgi:sugar diacid utilization regulator